MSTPTRKHIVVLENTSLMSAREIVHGILRYAANHPDWQLEVLTAHPSEIEESVCIAHPDGIISGFGDEPANPIPIAVRRRTPVVFTCGGTFAKIKAPHAMFSLDDREIAETAATFLLSKHLRTYGFFGLRHSMIWEVNRRKYFRTAIRQAGFIASVFRMERNLPVSSKLERIAVANWLKSLKKPCGIFAVNDRRAKLLLEVCEQEDISVPEQVKVIGVDNDEILCECAHPTLTSIMPDFRRVGYEAAKALDALMQGERVPKLQAVGIRETVERMSTSDMTGSNHRVSRARDILRRQVFNGGVSVDGLARTIGCSTRLLLKDFQSILGNSVVDEINQLRLAKVKYLLRNTSSDETTIAKTSGFKSPAYLRNLFHKRFGMTMREWRNRWKTRNDV